MVNKLKYNIPTIISPYAYVSKYAKIGSGSIIMHGSIMGCKFNNGKDLYHKYKSPYRANDVIVGKK